MLWKKTQFGLSFLSLTHFDFSFIVRLFTQLLFSLALILQTIEETTIKVWKQHKFPEY